MQIQNHKKMVDRYHEVKQLAKHLIMFSNLLLKDCIVIRVHLEIVDEKAVRTFVYLWT